MPQEVGDAPDLGSDRLADGNNPYPKATPFLSFQGTDAAFQNDLAVSTEVSKLLTLHISIVLFNAAVIVQIMNH